MVLLVHEFLKIWLSEQKLWISGTHSFREEWETQACGAPWAIWSSIRFGRMMGGPMVYPWGPGSMSGPHLGPHPISIMEIRCLLHETVTSGRQAFRDPPDCLIGNQIWSSDVGPLGDLRDRGIWDLDQWDPLFNSPKESQAWIGWKQSRMTTWIMGPISGPDWRLGPHIF